MWGFREEEGEEDMQMHKSSVTVTVKSSGLINFFVTIVRLFSSNRVHLE